MKKKGGVTLLGNNRTCFNRVIFSLNLNDDGKISYMRIQMSSSGKVRGSGNHYIYAESIINTFGSKFTTRDWYPLEPPLDGGSVEPNKKTNALGNLWMDYKLNKAFFETNVHVLTANDAQVTDIVINIQLV